MTDTNVQHGVDFGCGVTAQAVPDMTVAVAAGSVVNGNSGASVTAQNVTINAADATQDRYDLISIDSSGTVTYTAGTPGDVPVQPDNTDVFSAFVYVYSQASALYTGTITSSVIQDVRQFTLRHVSPYRVSTLWYGSPGNGSGLGSWTDQDMYLTPLFVAKNFSIQTMGCRISGGTATAGSKVRLGIYADDGSGALSLFVDCGQAAVDVAGPADVTISTSQTLTPGWWWLALAFQSLGATKPTMFVGGAGNGVLNSPIGGSSLLNAANGRIGFIKFPGISGALPTTPTSPTYSPSPVPGVWVQAA